MRNVAGVTTEIERFVPASALRGIEPGLVTAEAKILGRCRTGRRLQQVVRLAGRVGIVAREAVARRLIVNVATGRAFLVGVTSKTKFGWSGGEQLYARDILGRTHFMTAEAILLRGRVRVLVLRLVLMASDAGSCRDIRIQGSRMLLCDGRAR